MTNSPYELTLDNMINITTKISDEQNLALSIKLNGAIVLPAVIADGKLWGPSILNYINPITSDSSSSPIQMPSLFLLDIRLM